MVRKKKEKERKKRGKKKNKETKEKSKKKRKKKKRKKINETTVPKSTFSPGRGGGEGGSDLKVAFTSAFES